VEVKRKTSKCMDKYSQLMLDIVSRKNQNSELANK